jgi:hypothetical protein
MQTKGTVFSMVLHAGLLLMQPGTALCAESNIISKHGLTPHTPSILLPLLWDQSPSCALGA